MTKRPWRSKGKQYNKVHPVMTPGACVSLDQLEYPTPGFIAQLKEGQTKHRYRSATIFVDHASRLSYFHLQKMLTSAETVESKQAFESYARNQSVTVQYYHTYNGKFVDNAFIQSVVDIGQTISYCGVNAHFQNEISEKRIRDLQEQDRKQLLHAKSRWPLAIKINLWTYALQKAKNLHNSLPDREDGSYPIERFGRVPVAPRIAHNHTFVCPIYDLTARLQG